MIFGNKTYEVNFIEGQVELTRTCSVTELPFTVMVGEDAWFAYRNGAYAQNAFPELNADEREFIISGTTPAEWEEMFGGIEE